MFDKNVPAKREDSTQGGATRRQRKLRPSVAIALALMGVGAVFLRPRDPAESKRIIAHAPPVAQTQAPAPMKETAPAPAPPAKPIQAKPVIPPAPPLPEPTMLPEPQLAAAEGEPKAYPSRVSLKAQSATASTSSISQELKMVVTIQNTTRNTVQAFISDAPTATDDAGNSYTSTSLFGNTIGGIYVCGSGSRCLTEDKAKTESGATEVEPEGGITLTVTFCCKISGSPLPSKASAGIVLHTREAPEGEAYGAWRSASVGVPLTAVKIGK